MRGAHTVCNHNNTTLETTKVETQQVQEQIEGEPHILCDTKCYHLAISENQPLCFAFLGLAGFHRCSEKCLRTATLEELERNCDMYKLCLFVTPMLIKLIVEINCTKQHSE